mmetsp:Transcript_109162/g.163277  ORF Transcript_109162/g.163277 Transcript_109162/m.163277 type:complete len:212 (-) Transcript_109162:34-669(-)|eukprot:CAMPEP_0117000348 /NCGR_PEP_ID=MMETSP0472-20121206/2723_1 /TAXON_ID=693140 ORGANISM="Tiarina fusus, Strain LIS" /NCGR_SAMPLE_ID=MMETSP0472 /ASSEMBLY_ACC=CAM_ASM_000603 /LENGTH=211 /DNA_ID=CAMNT_0004700017 /DNA_START=44 /DNA_END=679 /DNA_ORIENTATION=+
MTTSAMWNIVATVAVCQLVCDLISNYLVFGGERYKRLVSSMERARWKLDKAETDLQKNPKNAKRHQRAKEDYGNACSEVAKRHIAPSTWSSIFFFIILRILGTEHQGNVMALLPFQPYAFVTKATGRGLDWSNAPEAVLERASVDKCQATSFLFIYLLAVLSVKYYVHRAVGTKAPAGADGGVLSLLESPQGQRMLKAWGVDPDGLKDGSS